MAKESEKKGKRGGRRPGAGRPASGSKLFSFRASGQLVSTIEAQENKTDFINSCIAHTLVGHGKLNALGEVVPALHAQPLELPFFDISMVAGFPIPLDNEERAQNVDLLRMLLPNLEDSYLIKVQGQSMIDAGINSGDLLIVDRSRRNPTETEVAVCELNGEYTVKRFVMRDGAGWLVPANPNFPEIEVGPEDDFSIWGVVAYIIHKPAPRKLV